MKKSKKTKHKRIKCFSVKHEYLKLIKEGKKKVELRIVNDYFKQIKEGDLLILFDGQGNVVRAKVIEIMHFKDLKDIFKRIPVEEVFPMENSTTKAINRLKKIYENMDRTKKIEIIAIRIKVIDYLWGKVNV